MSKPSLIGFVSGWAYDQPTIQPIDPTLVVPKGLALYAYLPDKRDEPKPETTLQVGDKVKIVAVVSYEPGWNEVWVQAMDDYVGDGEVYTVAGVRDGSGVELMYSDGSPLDPAWWWPPSSLQKVS